MGRRGGPPHREAASIRRTVTRRHLLRRHYSGDTYSGDTEALLSHLLERRCHGRLGLGDG